MSLRVYLAAPLALAPVVQRFARRVEQDEHVVTSTWFRDCGVADPLDPATRRDVWARCRREVVSADVLVLLAVPGSRPRATLVEVGIAMGAGLVVVWLQPEAERCIADADEDVILAASTDDVLRELSVLRGRLVA